MERNSEKGSAIIWILVAVALFAALNFAFNSGSRTSTSLLSDAEAEAYAAEIIAFGNDVKSSIKRMRLSGISIEELDFSDPILLYYWNSPAPLASNPNCTNNKCKVFSSEGGQLTAKIFEKIATEHTTSHGTGRPQKGHPWLYRTNLVNAGTSKNDLTLHIPRLPKNICLAINKALGINIDLNQLEGFGSKGNYDFYNIDTPVTVATDAVLGNQIPALLIKNSGCYKESNSNYYFYFLLIEPR